MTKKILHSKPIIAKLLNPLATKAKVKAKKTNTEPKLCIIQVGNDPASNSYIKQKQSLAKTNFITFEHIKLSSSVTESKLLNTIKDLALEKTVHGILLQFPLDGKIGNSEKLKQKAIAKITPDKDVDGLHPVNLGRMFCGISTYKKWKSPMPCTALGILRLLNQYKIKIAGKKIAVIGRSQLVGMPLNILLTQANGTSTLCHSRTRNLKEICKNADIIVAAAGKRHLVTPEWVKKDSVLIDVGIHLDGKSSKGKNMLSGDIDPECYKLSKAYSPVPGGVGPMTVCCLIENTLRLFLNRK